MASTSKSSNSSPRYARPDASSPAVISPSLRRLNTPKRSSIPNCRRAISREMRHCAAPCTVMWISSSALRIVARLPTRSTWVFGWARRRHRLTSTNQLRRSLG
eukprot:6197616-Pleurochrysis_carterae.AAC.1